MYKPNQPPSSHKLIKFYCDGTLVEENIESRSLLHFLYTKSLGKILRCLAITRFVSVIYGWLQASSISRCIIHRFVHKHAIKLSDFEEPKNGYCSFNDFFIRRLKPGARTIDHGESIITSPADAKLFVFRKIADRMTFFVKEMSFDLASFLGDAQLASRYNGGTMIICRLAPYDYHRFHAPVKGITSNTVTLSGAYESVNPIVYLTGLQPLLTNLRQRMVIETEANGSVVMVAVGAMLVGSITMTYQPGTLVHKGDELGFFSFGGSTVVMLFEPGTIVLDDALIRHSSQGYETAKVMGESIGCYATQEHHVLPLLSRPS